jgi:tetratricopeptide (TPR) repeat protein
VAGELISMHRSVKPHTWFAAERAMLVAVVQASADLAWYDLAWDLSLTLQRYLESQHHFRDWTRIVTTGLAAARSGQDRHAEAALLCSLGERHAVDDDHAAAAEAFASALRIARDCGYQRAQAHALRGLSTSHLARAEFREAHAAAQEALDLIDHTADPNAAAEIQMGLGAALHRLGQMDRAGLCYQRARQGFEQVGDRMNLAILLVDLGALYRDAGRFDESEQALLRSARICTEIGFHNGEAFAYCGLGSLLQRRGDTARAEQVLLEALAIVCEHTDLATECKIRRILGELYRPADPARARARFTESIALAAELRLNWQLVLALIGLGEAEQEAGDIAATAAAWRRAHDLLRTIDPERAGQLHGRLEALPVHAYPRPTARPARPCRFTLSRRPGRSGRPAAGLGAGVLRPRRGPAHPAPPGRPLLRRDLTWSTCLSLLLAKREGR